MSTFTTRKTTYAHTVALGDAVTDINNSSLGSKTLVVQEILFLYIIFLSFSQI